MNRRSHDNDPEHVVLMRVDLERSGLDDDDVKRMGLDALSADETAELTNDQFNVASYRIPYVNADGSPSDFYRLRFTSTTTFGKVTIAPHQRYWQPPNTAPHAYLAPGPAVDWATVARDATIELDMTEGEKKAYTGCKRELVVIGLS